MREKITNPSFGLVQSTRTNGQPTLKISFMLKIEDVQVYPWKLKPKVGVNKYTLEMLIVYPESPSFNPESWLTFDSYELAETYLKKVGIDNQNWFVNNLIALVDSERKIVEEGKSDFFDYKKIKEWVDQYTEKFIKK